MSHTVSVRLIADQEIEFNGRCVNIHNIMSVMVDAHGQIIDIYLEPEGETYRGWLSQENPIAKESS